MSYFTKRYHPPGTPPGTLSVTPGKSFDDLQIRLINYSSEELNIRENCDLADCRSCLDSDGVTWIHVQGSPSAETLKKLGSTFNLHALALEDVMNTGQRPKVDLFEDQMFLVMSLPQIVKDRIEVQQVSFFLGDSVLISFHDGDFGPFTSILKRLEDKASRLRSRGADYLLYGLIDSIIDQGFPVLEDFGFQMEELEEQILTETNRETLERIHTIKRELILLRRMLWPQREVINQLLHGDIRQIQEGTLIYLHDCYDHTIQVMDLLETYRDMTSSMLDIYLSSVSNRMNEVMRVLTVIATIFIPLTFIVGIYGMNFDRTTSPWSMPELGWPYGYLMVWLVMVSIAGVMIFAFRRRGWF